MSKKFKVSEREFKSIAAMARYVQGAQSLVQYPASTEHDQGPDWTLGWSFEDSVACALAGGRWEQGASKLKAAHVHTNKALKEACIPSQDYDVTGHTLDVGEYLVGNPEHWLAAGDDDTGALPIISVGVSTSRVHYIDGNHVVNRGAAILSCVDNLEAQGYRVELWAVHAVKSHGQATNYRTLIKSAEQPWSPSAAAFGMCHPAFSRRCMFRVMEAQEGVGKMGGGYGAGWDGAEVSESYDVWVPSMKNESAHRSPSEALKSVMSNFNDREG